MLVKEAIQQRFDSLRKLQEYGLTWQPSLIAPNNLVSNLNEKQMRFYAGVKLFDTIYAIAFNQRQAAADAVKTIEEIQDKLDLRSYADLSDSFSKTIKSFIAQRDPIDAKSLFEQLSIDYVQEIPILMSNEKTADYLIETLYGFTVEYVCILGYFQNTDPQGKLAQAINEQDIGGWRTIMANLFSAFDRTNETIRIEGKTITKVETIKRLLNIGTSPFNKTDASAYSQSLAIRTVMLSFTGGGE